jgi:hypothetical protein
MVPWLRRVPEPFRDLVVRRLKRRTAEKIAIFFMAV